MFKFVATKNSSEIFHRAVLQNDVARTRLIIEEAMKDSRFNVDDINSDGLTALQFSCFAGNLEIVKTLVQCGADWKIKDREGRSLLHASAMAGTLEVAKYLIRIGLKPILYDDKSCMPIDLTDDTAMIVLFLKAMLDQGYLKEMQEYMLDHPRLKRKIFQDVEMAKTLEREEISYTRDLPRASRRSAQVRNLGGQASMRRKSRGTFAALSDSLSSLHVSPVVEERHSVSAIDGGEDNHLSEKDSKLNVPQWPCLQRSGSICSSRSSSSSHSCNTNHLGVDNISASTRPVTGAKYYSDSDLRAPDFRESSHGLAHSQGYESDVYEELRAVHRRPASDISNFNSLHSSASISSYMSASDDTRNGYFKGNRERSFKETIYENLPLQTRGSADDASECMYTSVSAFEFRDCPPPVPPRRPVLNESCDFPALTSPDLPNETDSGIDVNEAAGRVFQLSLEDPSLVREYDIAFREEDPYFDVPTVCEPDESLSYGFVVGKPVSLPSFSNKYLSWNSRSLQETGSSLSSLDRVQRRAIEYEELQRACQVASCSAPGNDSHLFEGVNSGLGRESQPPLLSDRRDGLDVVPGGWVHSESGKFYPEILL